jgi:hypothetical protein
MMLRRGFNLDIEFAADKRNPAACISRRVTSVLFVANAADPVDITILRIESCSSVKRLVLAKGTVLPPKNLYVVGHPRLTMPVANDVKSVFGNRSGKKRVSFGQLPAVIDNDKTILYDDSTVGGSGGAVLGISGGEIAELHYYRRPATGNGAVSAAAALHEHPVEQYGVGE